MPLPELAPPSVDTPLQLAPGDMIQKGWQFIKPHLVVVIVVSLVSVVIGVVLQRIPLAGTALGMVWNITIGAGMYNNISMGYFYKDKDSGKWAMRPPF